MTRADVCASEDHATRDRLQEVLASQGFVGDTDNLHSALGVGLSRFRRGESEVTVFVDAWVVDLAGPTELVNAILEAI